MKKILSKILGGKVLGGLFAIFLLFTSYMTWGFFSYRSQIPSNDASLVVLEKEKGMLVAKVAALENTLQRIQKFTDKLEASIGVESGKLGKGVGPLSEQENLSEFLSRVSKLPSLTPPSLQRDYRLGKLDDHFFQKISFKLDDLDQEATGLEERVHDVYEANEDRISFWSSTPSLWPVHGWVTSAFGYRLSPWGEGVKMHRGIDIASPFGSTVFAPSDGVVVFSGNKGGYGRALIIDHGYGITTLYGHNSDLFVKEGDRIVKGERIAAVGNSGASTGPHLHYEVHVDGIPTDPMRYLFQ